MLGQQMKKWPHSNNNTIQDQHPICTKRKQFGHVKNTQHKPIKHKYRNSYNCTLYESLLHSQIEQSRGLRYRNRCRGGMMVTTPRLTPRGGGDMPSQHPKHDHKKQLRLSCSKSLLTAGGGTCSIGMHFKVGIQWFCSKKWRATS